MYILITIRHIKVLYMDVVWLIVSRRFKSHVFPIHLLTGWRCFKNPATYKTRGRGSEPTMNTITSRVRFNTVNSPMSVHTTQALLPITILPIILLILEPHLCPDILPNSKTAYRFSKKQTVGHYHQVTLLHEPTANLMVLPKQSTAMSVCWLGSLALSLTLQEINAS